MRSLHTSPMAPALNTREVQSKFANHRWLSTPAGVARASPDAQEHRRFRESRSRAWQGDEAPPPMLSLFCAACGSQLSKRGMCVQLAVDATIMLYSTDTEPDSRMDLGIAGVVPGQCSCQVQDFACKCGLRVGYHLVLPCKACEELQEDQSHRWFMSSNCIRAEPRRDAKGEVLFWPCTPDENLPSQSAWNAVVPPLPSLKIGQEAVKENVPCASLLAETNGLGWLNHRKTKPAAPADTMSHSWSGDDPAKLAAVMPTAHLEGMHCREAAVLERESAVRAREDQVTAREAELFNKSLEHAAKDRFLRDVTVAQQEAEAHLRNREESVAQREAALRQCERSTEVCHRPLPPLRETTSDTVSEASTARVEGKTLLLNAMLAAKGSEAQSLRAQAAADAQHSYEEAAQLQTVARRAEAEAAREGACVRGAIGRLEGLQQELGGLQAVGEATRQVDPQRLDEMPASHQQASAARASQAASPTSKVRATPLSGHLAESLEARLQCAQRLADKRNSLARWEESLTARAQALSESEWRLEAERLTLAAKASKDGSGVPPRPSAWGCHQMQHASAPLPRLPGWADWIRHVTGCGHSSCRPWREWRWARVLVAGVQANCVF